MDLHEIPGMNRHRHPWEVTRALFFRRVLEDVGAFASKLAVLDVGAGDGYLAGVLLKALPGGSEVVCVDSNYTDADLAVYMTPQRPGLSFHREPPSRRFGLLLMLDVIEHVADDRAFLGGLVAQNLAPGGLVLVSVPAWQALFSSHDTALKHYRRYSPGACQELLQAEGLIVMRRGGLFHSLVIPRAYAVAREALVRRLGIAPTTPDNLGRWRHGALVSTAIECSLALDNRLTHMLARRGLELPGLSAWALCRTRDGVPT